MFFDLEKLAGQQSLFPAEVYLFVRLYALCVTRTLGRMAQGENRNGGLWLLFV